VVFVVTFVSFPKIILAEALVPLTTLNTNFPILPVPFTGAPFVLITSANINFPGVDVSAKRVM